MDARQVASAVDRSLGLWGPTALRVLAGLLWLSNVSWKVPPEFGDLEDRCRGLCRFVELGTQHPVVPGSTWVFDNLVQPNLAVFGWVTLFVEAGLAATLLSGRFLRTAAVVGIAQSLGIALAVANAPEEWYWSYGLMVGLHLAVLVTAPAARPTPSRVAAGLLGAYGVGVAVAHLDGGLTNTAYTLFQQQNDFPGDFGRQLLPGSIGLGIILVVVAVVVWIVSSAEVAVRSAVGWVLVGVSVALLLTYGPDGLLLRLGSRATTAAVLAAVGLTLTVTGSRRGVGADTDLPATEPTGAGR